MTLFATDYLEYYLTLVSWIVNNGIWAVLVSSGVFALPFVAIIVQEWLKARGEGADEGNKGVLSAARIENRVFVAIVVVMFAGIPFIDVDLNTIQYDSSRSAQCQVSVPQPTDTGWSQSFSTINNQSAKVPVWWAFMHALSRAVTSASVAAIPCGTDLRQMRMEIDATRINDPVLAQEVADFTHDCYGPARAKLFMARPELDEAQMNDVTWIGSRFFTDTGGYYDSYRSSTARESWPYDDTRDAGLAQVASGGGYPTCRQWWADGSNGLRARLLSQVDPSLLNRLAGWAGFLSRTEVDDSVVRYHRVTATAEAQPGFGLYRLRRPDRQDPAEHRDAGHGGRRNGGRGTCRIPCHGRGAPGAAHGACLAQDGAGHLHPARAGRRHL